MLGEFFEALYADGEFCRELGRAVLASGELESALKEHVERAGSSASLIRKATLGRLTRLAKQDDLASSQFVAALEVVTMQRNYLAHNLFELYTGRIEETLLARDLSVDEVDELTYRASQLAEELRYFASLVREGRVDT